VTTEIKHVAQHLAPGIPWETTEDATTGAEYAGASLGLPGENMATVNLVTQGGEWIAELVISDADGFFPRGAKIQATGQTARGTWDAMLALCAMVGEARPSLVAYEEHARLTETPPGVGIAAFEKVSEDLRAQVEKLRSTL